jgi:heme A synthase
MTTYIFSVIFAAAMILIAALISSAIQYEGGSNPTDPKKRKIWFWILAIVNPILYFVLGAFVLAPKADDDQMIYDDYMAALPIATAVGFVLYIILGFVLSKVFQKGKIGNWF